MFLKARVLAPLALATMLAGGLPSVAQQVSTPPASTTAPTTLPETTPTVPGQPTTTGSAMTKSDLKAQHKQQKQEEKAANAKAKAAKSTAKAKKDADKAQQQQEKAGERPS